MRIVSILLSFTGKTARASSNKKATKQVPEPEVGDESEDEVIPAKKSRVVAEEWGLSGPF